MTRFGKAPISHLTYNGCANRSRRYNEEQFYGKWADILNDMADSAKKAGASVEKVSKGITSIAIKEEKERDIDMKVYYVKFEGTDKLYAYYCAPHIELKIGSSYMIEADRSTTYKNAITVVKIDNNEPAGVHIRTITHARLLTGAKRPDDKIKRVIFNKGKRTTVVLWYDGQKTIVKQQDGDVWDEEKALALCYMKRILGNRGSFNETLKKYCNKTPAEKTTVEENVEKVAEEN